MPDYTACAQISCERRHGCARYLMRWGRYQSITRGTPACCGLEWPLAWGTSFALLTPEEADQQARSFHPSGTVVDPDLEIPPPAVFVPCDDTKEAP